MSIPSPIVETKYGSVRGFEEVTDAGRKYYAFQGIPYASKPVGKLRFKDPLPLKPWQGVWDATNEAQPAFAFNPWTREGATITGSDDCLYLNVYTTNLHPSHLLPVLIWIHPGGFNTGSGSLEVYGPDYLIDREVIVVTFNFRLGPLGHLSFRDPKVGVPGNAGLKDQVMAMRWIKENIVNFGGSCTNITLAGLSSGSAAVHFHLMSPLSKGLFNRAIMMSGTAFAPWVMLPDGVDFTRKLAKVLGYDGPDEDEDIFRFISVYDLHRVITASCSLITSNEMHMKGYLSAFLPTVEPYHSKMCFLPDSPLILGRKAWGNDIDVLIGGTSDEGLIFLQSISEKVHRFVKENDILPAPVELQTIMDEKSLKEAGSKLKKTYNITVRSTIQEDTQIIVRYFSDRNMWHGIKRTIMQRVNSKRKGKTYLYHYTAQHAKDIKFLQVFRQIVHIPLKQEGVCHAEDIPMLFKTMHDEPHEEGAPAYTTFKKAIGYYTRFVQIGSPNPPRNPFKKQCKVWQPIRSKQQLQCLEMGGKWEMTDLPYTARLEIWDSLYPEEMLY